LFMCQTWTHCITFRGGCLTATTLVAPSIDDPHDKNQQVQVSAKRRHQSPSPNHPMEGQNWTLGTGLKPPVKCQAPNFKRSVRSCRATAPVQLDSGAPWRELVRRDAFQAKRDGIPPRPLPLPPHSCAMIHHRHPSGSSGLWSNYRTAPMRVFSPLLFDVMHRIPHRARMWLTRKQSGKKTAYRDVLESKHATRQKARTTCRSKHWQSVGSGGGVAARDGAHGVT
jgi:hypothetical protein